MSSWLLEGDNVPSRRLKLFVTMRGGAVALEMKPLGVIFVVIYHCHDPLHQLLIDTRVYHRDIDEVTAKDLDRVLFMNQWCIDSFLSLGRE